MSMQNSDRAWKSFARPVGITLSWILSISFVIALICGSFVLVSPSKAATAWDRECSLVGEEFGQGQVSVCVHLERIIEYPTYDYGPWKQGCLDLGGIVKSRNGMQSCFKATRIEGMEPRP